MSDQYIQDKLASATLTDAQRKATLAAYMAYAGDLNVVFHGINPATAKGLDTYILFAERLSQYVNAITTMNNEAHAFFKMLSKTYKLNGSGLSSKNGFDAFDLKKVHAHKYRRIENNADITSIMQQCEDYGMVKEIKQHSMSINSVEHTWQTVVYKKTTLVFPELKGTHFDVTFRIEFDTFGFPRNGIPYVLNLLDVSFPGPCYVYTYFMRTGLWPN
jgi:hypothetical protein